jgi:hypothetical protein
MAATQRVAVRASSRSAARPDGYCSVAGHVWRLFRGPHGALRQPSDAEYRYVMSAAQRLDAANRQFERVREGIAAAVAAPRGSFTQQDAVFAAGATPRWR